MSKLLVNLAHVAWMDTGDDSGEAWVYFYKDENTQIAPAKDITVYGEGELIVNRWLREIAGEEENED